MFPKVNQNIVVDVIDRDLSHRSIIAEIDGHEILISFPMEGNSLGLFPDGTKLFITYFIAENKYRFKTEIVGRKKDTISLYRVLKPEPEAIIRIQQRENFRVNTNLQLVLNNDIELFTLNLSVGGMMFSCMADLQLQVGETVSCTLFLPDTQTKESEPISIQAKILRIKEQNNKVRKNVGVKFLNLNQKSQMKIRRYCIEKQKHNRLQS